jgi:hypothetical protein
MSLILRDMGVVYTSKLNLAQQGLVMQIVKKRKEVMRIVNGVSLYVGESRILINHQEKQPDHRKREKNEQYAKERS